MESVLCLDLGILTGWAAVSNGQIESGVQAFKLKKTEGYGVRYVNFEAWLTERIALTGGGVEAVYYEDVLHHTGTKAAHCYGAFKGVIGMVCERRGIPYVGVNVKTIKKFMAGTGNASKAQMIEAIRKMGHEPADDNEADAISLLYYSLHQRGSTTDAGISKDLS